MTILNKISWIIVILSTLGLVSYYFPNFDGENLGRFLGAYVLPAIVGIGIYFHFKNKKKAKKKVKDEKEEIVKAGTYENMKKEVIKDGQ